MLEILKMVCIGALGVWLYLEAVLFLALIACLISASRGDDARGYDEIDTDEILEEEPWQLN